MDFPAAQRDNESPFADLSFLIFLILLRSRTGMSLHVSLSPIARTHFLAAQRPVTSVARHTCRPPVFISGQFSVSSHLSTHSDSLSIARSTMHRVRGLSPSPFRRDQIPAAQSFRPPFIRALRHSKRRLGQNNATGQPACGTSVGEVYGLAGE